MPITQRNFRSAKPLMRPFILIVLVLAHLALAGCQGPVERLFPTPTPRPTPRPTAEVDVCKLISLKEVESIVGVSLQTSPMLNEYGGIGGEITCWFLNSDKSGKITVTVAIDQPYNEITRDAKENMFLFDQVHPDFRYTEVEEFGDRAYMEKATPEEENNPDTIYSFEVLKGDFVSKISLTRKMSRQQREDWLKAIMKIVLSRLPATVANPISGTATPKP